jgi:hypothetical protein
MPRLLMPCRALVAAVALAIALSLAACGGSSGKASQATTTRSSAAARQQSRQAATTGGASNGAASRKAQAGARNGGTATRQGRAATGGTSAGASPQTGANGSTARNGAARKPAQTSASLARRRAALQHVISVYSACLRQHGVKLPSPTSNGSPLTGVDTSSPQYKHASVACRAVAIAALRAASRQLHASQR